MKIANLEISPHHPPLVVPEIGINHNGSLEIAKLMVDAAARAGAKIIKHQTHIIEDEMSKAAKSVIPGNAKISIYEIMKKCSLSLRDERELKEYTEKKGLVYLSTPFSRAAANRLEDMGVVAYKIGSGECNNYPLIRHIANFKKPMILSTGMNSIDTVAPSVEILREFSIPFALLHTTNLYPTPPHLVRLSAMSELRAAFSPGGKYAASGDSHNIDCSGEILVGLSDHTLNNLACLGAVALGACVLERHFTDTLQREGPDIICSMDEAALADLLTRSEEMFILRGIAGARLKEAAKEEQVTIDFAFASVVSIATIKAGDVFSQANIWVKRPGGGIPASEFENILGKKALHDIDADVQISREDFQ